MHQFGLAFESPAYEAHEMLHGGFARARLATEFHTRS
jgi:hypothetical protein